MDHSSLIIIKIQVFRVILKVSTSLEGRTITVIGSRFQSGRDEMPKTLTLILFKIESRGEKNCPIWIVYVFIKRHLPRSNRRCSSQLTSDRVPCGCTVQWPRVSRRRRTVHPPGLSVRRGQRYGYRWRSSCGSRWGHTSQSSAATDPPSTWKVMHSCIEGQLHNMPIG